METESYPTVIESHSTSEIFKVDEKYLLHLSLVQLVSCAITCSWLFLRTGETQNWFGYELAQCPLLTVANWRCLWKTYDYFPSVFFQLQVICCSEASRSKAVFHVSCNPQYIYLLWVSSHTPLKSKLTSFVFSDPPPISSQFSWWKEKPTIHPATFCCAWLDA